MGEMEKALKSFEESLKVCTKFFPDESFELCNLVNIYANIKSVCSDDLDNTMNLLEETHKIAMRVGEGRPSTYSADLLDTMGKVCMRRDSRSEEEALKFGKMAEDCFTRSIKQYRFAKMDNVHGKVTEVFCNLLQAQKRIRILNSQLAPKMQERDEEKNNRSSENNQQYEEGKEFEDDSNKEENDLTPAISDDEHDNHTREKSVNDDAKNASSALESEATSAFGGGFLNFFFPFGNDAKSVSSWDSEIHTACSVGEESYGDEN